jgi:hypothetical protein
VIFSQCAPVFYDEPVKALAEDCVWIHHSFLLVEYLESHWDETQESAVFILTTLFHFFSAIVCVILAAAQSLSLLQVVK